MWSWAWKRTAEAISFCARHGRQIERAHDDALVGHADAHALAELVLGEELAQDVGQRLHVHDLAVAYDAGGQRRHGGALDGDAAAGLHRGDVAGLNVESNDVLGGGSSHARHSDRRGWTIVELGVQRSGRAASTLL